MKYCVHISMTHNYFIFNMPYIHLFISISQSWTIPNIVSCEIETCYKMAPVPPCLSTLWFVPAPKTKVVCQEGPLLVCHSTLIQYLVVHNCKLKNSLQNFTSFVQCCGNNIINQQQTCKPWKNSKALNLLWSITTTQHNKIQQKDVRYKKGKKKKWFTFEQPNHSTLHILGNNWVLDWDSIFWATTLIPPN